MPHLARRIEVPSSVLVGVLATLSMDAFFLAAARLGGARFTSDKVGLEPVGRWAAGLTRGRFRHQDIASEPAVRGEALLGLAVHYVTGIALTKTYHQAVHRGALKPGVPTATAFGVATALLPTMILYPSWGLGPFALRSGEAPRLLRVMVLGHTAFGAAIGVWTALLLRPKAD